MSGLVCPFCTAADPAWPDHYMRATYIDRNGVERPSARFRCLVSVKCLECGATWTRETGKWVRS